MSIENGWFYEKNSQWPGQAMGLEIKEMLLEQKTKYQDLKVFESTTWGKVLILDGVIQLTEKDEMSYQEMLAHIPMFSHRQPKRVLIVGGGDGGILREVCKHNCVEEIVQCEIDEGVIEASKRFFPTISNSFQDKRLKLIIDDAVHYVIDEAKNESFDVIIVDSSDPDGPAEKLFSEEFYKNASRILTKDGILSTQGECVWIHGKLMAEMKKSNGKHFTSAEYASIQVPTYPCGQISAFVLSKNQDTCSIPLRKINEESIENDSSEKMHLRYYTSKMHEAAFVLPAFVQKNLCSQ